MDNDEDRQTVSGQLQEQQRAWQVCQINVHLWCPSGSMGSCASMLNCGAQLLVREAPYACCPCFATLSHAREVRSFCGRCHCKSSESVNNSCTRPMPNAGCGCTCLYGMRPMRITCAGTCRILASHGGPSTWHERCSGTAAL